MFCLIQLYYHSLLRYCAHQTFFQIQTVISAVVKETTEIAVNKIIDYDVKRNCNLAYQLLKQSQANRQSN